MAMGVLADVAVLSAGGGLDWLAFASLPRFYDDHRRQSWHPTRRLCGRIEISDPRRAWLRACQCDGAAWRGGFELPPEAPAGVELEISDGSQTRRWPTRRRREACALRTGGAAVSESSERR